MTLEQPRTIVLPDGRRLAYAEYGDPAGRPVMIFHGTPGSRAMSSVADAPAAARGVRVIAPERPGIGYSDYQPGRSFSDWPVDVACLADALGCERFAVVGISGGGPFALACAAASALAARLDGVGVVSGAGPFDTPGAFDGMPLRLRMGWAVVRGAPWTAGATLRGAGAGLLQYPEQAHERLLQVGPEADRAILAREEIRALLLRDVRETFRQGTRGAAHDLRLYAGPWDFALADVALRVHLWHGEADRIVPITQARAVANALPRCEPMFIADAGHFWFVDHVGEVLDALTAREP